MTHAIDILAGIAQPMAGPSLNAVERLGAARSWVSRAGSSGSLGLFLLLIVLAIALGALAWLLIRRWRMEASQRAAVAEQAARLELTRAEQYVLSAVVKAARLRNTATLFTTDHTFEHGVGAMTRTSRFAGMGADRREEVLRLVASLRAKLGFAEPGAEAADGDAPGAPAGGHADLPAPPRIAAGDRLSVVHRGRPGGFEVHVASAGDGEMVVHTPAEGPFPPGETWLVRCVRDGAMWEFDTPVISSEGGEVRLGDGSRPRFVNRRRFPRVGTSAPAEVAAFPFRTSGARPAAKEFVEGELVEIAGPGLKVEADLASPAGQRVLVMLRFGGDDAVEGVGTVRRVERREGAEPRLVVELTGLTGEELAKLTQETNHAARRGAAPAPTAPAAPAWRDEQAPAGKEG